MNIVRINSGLGNQMFQYAFSCALKQREPDTKIDVSDFLYRKHHNGYELDKIFTLNPSYASQKECNKLADVSKSFCAEIRRNFFKIKRKAQGIVVSEYELPTKYNPEVLEVKNAYFIGFWQTEKYFADIAPLIHKEFMFRKPLDKYNEKIANEIQQCHAVSIHFRRGDYLKKKRLHSTGSVCSLDYYKNAIELIHQQVASPHFFIFSDDIAWVKENFVWPNATYIDHNKKKNSFKDMQLMSLCKHNIIANSSFSWWGAWLNRYEKKIVCAPEVWVRGVDLPDIIPDSWIKIPIE